MKVPVNLDLEGQWILMVGGGPGALAKLGALADGLTQQEIPAEPLTVRVVAPDIHPDLQAFLGRADLAPWLRWDLVPRKIRRGDFKRSGRLPGLVYSFTGDSVVEARVAAWARRLGLWVNAAGQRGGFSSPAQRVEMSGDTPVLITQGSLRGSPRTRGQDPKTARDFPGTRTDVRGSFMPFMLDLQKVVVLAGDRGEGLQKAEKLALFAREVIVVPEVPTHQEFLVFGPGPMVHVEEDLVFDREVRVAIWPRTAAQVMAHSDQEKDLWSGVNYACSDLEDPALNQKFHTWAQGRGLRHTVIDQKEFSDVWYMSLIQRGPLLAALSTQGTVAYYAKQLRKELEAQWPQRAEMARILGTLRNRITPALRKIGLETIYHDGEFQTLVAEGRETEAFNRADQLIEKIMEAPQAVPALVPGK